MLDFTKSKFTHPLLIEMPPKCIAKYTNKNSNKIFWLYEHQNGERYCLYFDPCFSSAIGIYMMPRISCG